AVAALVGRSAWLATKVAQLGRCCNFRNEHAEHAVANAPDDTHWISFHTRRHHIGLWHRTMPGGLSKTDSMPIPSASPSWAPMMSAHVEVQETVVTSLASFAPP